MENENTVSAKLNRIDTAFDRIRVKTEMPNDAIEDVATAVEGLKDPIGNINITDTTSTDVTNYATAQVVDANLIAENIRKDTTVLGITGSLEEGITPTGTLNITANDTYDVTNYASAQVNVPGITPSGTYNISSNGTYNITNYASANVAVVDVEAVEKDINFYDCDGFRVASWTLSELSGKTSLPTINRNHDGLVFEEWNWTLAQLKTNNNKMDVGALYKTSNNRTKLYMNIDAPNITVNFSFRLSKSARATIYWGDGSSTSQTGSSLGVMTYTKTHTYSSAGNYVIEIAMPTYSSGDYIGFHGDVPSSGNKVNIFGEVTSTNYYVFNCLYKVELSGQFLNMLNRSAFNSCKNLREFVVSTKSDDPGAYCFYDCESLKQITLSQDATKIADYCFSACYGLRRVFMPYTLNTICQYTFNNCYNLESAILPDKTTYTTLPTNFYSSCRTLRRAIIPKGITTIETYSLGFLQNLKVITIPSSVTNIGTQAIYSCTGTIELHFKGSTPPTAAATSSFYNLPTICKIYVPSSKLSTYKSAANYPSSSTYTYVGE